MSKRGLPEWSRASVDFPYPFGGFDDDGAAWIGLGGVASTPEPLFPVISEGIREVVSESGERSGVDIGTDAPPTERYELGPAAQSVFGEVLTAWESIKPILENIDLLLSSAGWLVAVREKYRHWHAEKKQETLERAKRDKSRVAVDFYFPEPEMRISPASAVLLSLSDAVGRHGVRGEGKVIVHFCESPHWVSMGDPFPWNRYIVQIQSRQLMLCYLLNNQAACHEHFQLENASIKQISLPNFHNPYGRALAPAWDEEFRVGEYRFLL